MPDNTRHSRAIRRGFTLTELMVVAIIMAITAGLGIDAISTFEANARANRAACECLAAFRYARSLAISTGNNACVSFNTASNTFSVFYSSDGVNWDPSPVTQPLAQGRVYTLTLSNIPELKGTTFSLNPSTAVQFTYFPLGNCDTAATITFNFGAHSEQLVVPLVGDPQLN